MRIHVEKFLIKQGNRVGKAAIEFENNDGLLAGFHLLGFTICDDPEKGGMFVLFPAAITNKKDTETGKNRPFFFLRPTQNSQLDDLEEQILDVFDSIDKFNRPRMKTAAKREVVSQELSV